MPRFFCDYCDAYLTHDSAPGRQQHIRGWKHRENFKAYYQSLHQQWMVEQQIKHMQHAQEYQMQMIAAGQLPQAHVISQSVQMHTGMGPPQLSMIGGVQLPPPGSSVPIPTSSTGPILPGQPGVPYFRPPPSVAPPVFQQPPAFVPPMQHTNL